MAAPSGEFLSVSAGREHSCAVRTDQSIVCWGDNQAGQTDSPSGEFLSVSAGYKHSCAMRTDQSAVCWGDNTSGIPADAEPEDYCRIGRTCFPGTYERIDAPGQSDAPPGRFARPPT